MSAFLELAERCEKATKPDRELDLAIGAAVGEADHSGPAYHRPFKDWAKPYTASIDAAMTLVPKAFWLTIKTGTQKHAPDFEWPIVKIGRQSDGTEIWQGQAMTLPLTLCAAALRALSHNGTRKER